MHFFCDFEAVNNSIVAAAFVSVDGSVEEHWLMKPYPAFKRLEGVYARLLPYSNQEIASAPLLRSCAPRFRRLLDQADALWFYGNGDLRFFQDSFPYYTRMQQTFAERYVDGKQLVEEILTPIYVRDTRNGNLVNFRNVLHYIEKERLNAKQELELYRSISQELHQLNRIAMQSATRLQAILAYSFQAEKNVAPELLYEEIVEVLHRVHQSLHPATLLGREAAKDLRWLRTRLARLHFTTHRTPRLISGMTTRIDHILTILGQRISASKLTIDSFKEFIYEQQLPLEVVELFAEARLDKESCMRHFGREIGLVNAANLLLEENWTEELTGEEHNALYDSRLLRMVILNCFQRYAQIEELSHSKIRG